MSLFRSEVLEERSRSQWGSIIVTQAPALRWASFALLLACVLGAGCMLRLDYARKEPVAGDLEPTGGIAEVSARMPGLVAELHVREGTVVQRGQPLLALDLGRLDEQGVPIHVVEADHVAASIGRLDELAAAQAEKHAADLQSIRRELAHLHTERRGIEDEMAIIKERQALSVRAEERLAELVLRSLVSGAEFDRRRQETLATQQSASQLKRALVGNQAQADSRRAALTKLEREFRVQQLQVQQDRAALERRLEQARNEHRTTIVAPRAGVAAFLQFAVGDRVTADQVLMTIAPDAPSFELVLLADAATAGRIEAGDVVRFWVQGAQRDADPSGAALVREGIRTPQQPYRLVGWIRVEGPVFRARAEVIDYPEKLGLRHGVRVDAFVVTTSKTLWRWLIEPVASALESL